MLTYFRFYDWVGGLDLDSDEKLIYSIILHFSENEGAGFYAGYTGLRQRTGIRKSKCKRAVQTLLEIGAIEESTQTIHGQVRKVLKATQFFIDQNLDDD